VRAIFGAGITMDQRLAILNGFGRTLGDSIIGLQALHAAHAMGLLRRDVVLFRLPGISPILDDLYTLAADLAEIRTLPWEYATPADRFRAADGFAEVLDIRDFAFDPRFRGVAMIDYFLERLGVDPTAVPARLRRNTWLASLLPPAASAEYVLVCPRTSSPMRDMPERVHQRILDWLVRHSPVAVRTQADLPRAASLTELAALVGGARLVISADTAMVHLADAMAVPCLAFFTTHEPRWRMRDYPLCTPIHLATHRLPPALEFPRDDRDIAAAQNAWFPDGDEPAWLDEILAAAWAGVAMSKSRDF
jgi:hypothetical protein